MTSSPDFFDNDLFKLLKDTHYSFDPDDDPNDPDWVEDDEFEPEEVREDSGKAPYLGKDGTHWHADPVIKPVQSTLFTQKIYVPSPDKAAKQAGSPFEHWQLLIDDEIVNKLLIHTNAEVEDKKKRLWKNPNRIEQTYYKAALKNELIALFGLLYLLGV